MPRGERPLDAGGGPLVDFAAKLRRLREQAGSPTYRDLARRAHYSIAALSGAAAGRQLPTLAVTLAYVRACGGDEREWEQAWREAAAACAAGSADAGPRRAEEGAAAPYAGLAPFQQSDADSFFGREHLTENLVEHLRKRRLLALFGASGSGKSSVLRAGLLPKFPATPSLVLTPGPHPVEECAIQLAARAHISPGTLRSELAAEPRALHRVVRQILARPPHPTNNPTVAPKGAPEDAPKNAPADAPKEIPEETPTGDFLLIVDQFEELFTLCHDADERHAFVTSLLHTARTPDSRCRVVVAVRSDFYTHCTRLPGLVDVLADAHVPVGPMTIDELRAAVVRPAARAGLTVEGALLAALTAAAHGRPGTLPLLSHALLETWHRRRGNALTLAGFQAAGGFEGALAHTAEAFHSGLSEPQQQIARQLFLRLIALGEGTEDTKRRVPRHEIDDTPDTAQVLEQATRARLLTADRDRVEITHEALIGCWPRLGLWLSEDRDQLRRHRALTEATAVWESLGRDPDTLYRGVRLAAVKDLPHHALTTRERAFREASESAERTEARRVRRRVRRLRQLVVALVALLLCATAAIGFAVRSQQIVTAQRNHVLALKAIDTSAALRPRDPSLATQLALAAHRLEPSDATRNNLLSVLSRTLDRHSHALAVTGDGRTLATARDDGGLQLWDLTDPRHPTRLGSVADNADNTDNDGNINNTGNDGNADNALSLAFGPRGDTLVGIGRDRAIRLWDLTDPRHPHLLSTTPTHHTDLVFSLAASPDGRTLATSSYDDTIRLWDVRDPARPHFLNRLTGHSLNVKPVAFSPDGTTLASGSDDRTVRLWDVTDPLDTPTIALLKGHDDFVDTLAYSRDGHTLLSGSDDHTARLWDVTDPRHPRRSGRLDGHTGTVTSGEFTPDGSTVVTTSQDGTLRIWETTSRTSPVELASLTGLSGGLAMARALSAPGAIVTLSHDHTIDLWNTDPSWALAHACERVRTTISRAQWARHFPGLDYRAPCGG
ncbi:XRE family transcriptional regulator [Streptomyces sp. NPDC003077]|uniref:nSTAND1 domain-containing NTPase n=1 Tax=Streptomyces sp. NPDC003077 TaxID=3154443 RepID=UPI0033B0BC31